LLAGERFLKRAVEARDLAQESGVVILESVLDLVGDRQPGQAQHSRLPDLRHPGLDQRLVVGQFARAEQGFAAFYQFSDGPFGSEDALPLDLGGMRREDG